MKRLITLVGLAIGISACAQPVATYKELYRPRFHYSPEINWCNDPNGLVYNNGVYHLFHQYNPSGNVWGHMSWAHAVSQDLVHWKHMPLAIAEENGVMIFSGSCVVDKNNSSGFARKPGQHPMVAIYTGHIDNTSQSQHLAYSLDEGITWAKYPGNPVLDLHKKDFRDPRVFWFAPKKYWVMAVVLPDEHIVQFYSSPNLKQWTHLSNFGPVGDTAAVWECPDLAEVPVSGSSTQKKWVLQTSQNTSMQYFVGSFDGTRFINENPAGNIARPDYGPEFYAGISFNQLPANQSPTMIGWVNNWNYANDIPTTPWKGAMSLPRTLSVKKIKDTWVLLQQPEAALNGLRKPLAGIKNKPVDGDMALPFTSNQCEIDLLLQPAADSSSGLLLATGTGHGIEIGYDATAKQLYIDRDNAGETGFNKNFEKMHRYSTPVSLMNKTLRLHVYFDNSIVEVFANEGEAVLTAQFFPDRENNGSKVFSRKGKSTVLRLAAWQMKSVW